MTGGNFPAVVVVGGPRDGVALSLDEILTDFSIGSDDGCHLSLPGASISPMHAALFLDDEGTVTISDTKSRTGVFVNGARVTEHALSDSDEISIGPPGDPEGAQLRFAAEGVDVPLVDLGDEVSADVAGLGDISSFQVEAPLAIEDTGVADFQAQSVSMPAESPSFDPVGVPELAPMPSFEEAQPSLVDEFPPLEMAPEAEPEPEPQPAPVVETPAPRASNVTASGLSLEAPDKPKAKKPTSQRVAPLQSDGPLSGLAESLGSTTGRQRIELPKADAPAPIAKKRGIPISAKAARTGAVVIALIALAWMGVRKYSDSIVVPVVDSYLPNPAEPGQTVTLTGSGFGSAPDPAEVKVLIGDTEGRVLDASPTRINFTIPETLGASGTQTLSLQVVTSSAKSTARLLKVATVPKIDSLTPRVALTGDEVSIAGKWLSNAKAKPVVTVLGTDATILEATPTRIRIKVPGVSATEGQRVSVKVAVGSDIGKEALLNYGRLPFVETTSPDRASPGDLVTITGLGFAAPDLAVAVAGKAAAVLSSSDTEIKISMPGLRLSDNAGTRELLVQANQRVSTAHPISVLRESSALYAPRFFVETRDGRAAVANELGPVMVLGSDAGAVKRAHEAAAKLNQLASRGRESRVQFVAGNVAISAGGVAVLSVAPGDGNGNARSLAEVWTAELNDLFDLFLQGRRPGRTVEVSPDGKVFLDIYAAARRRSAEPGVPQGLLISPDPSWTQSFAVLAASPTLGSAQAGALVDGYWAGVVEVPGAIQPEKIEISLTATPSGVVGQRTSRRGGLSTDMSLQSLTFTRRELRFSYVDSGQTFNYQGRLDGDVIDGVVTKASGARVGKLTFTLSR